MLPINKYKGKFRDEMSPADYASYYRACAEKLEVKLLSSKQKKELIGEITYSSKYFDKNPAGTVEELVLTPKIIVASMTDKKVNSILSDGSGVSLEDVAEFGLPAVKPYSFDNLMPFEFRESQGIAYSLIMRKARELIKKVIVSLPPSSGKTILAIAIVIKYLKKHPSKTVFFCVHVNSLVLQSFIEFKKWTGEDVGVIQASNELHLDRPIQIVSLETIKNRLGKDSGSTLINSIFRKLDVGLIFIDECHRKTKGAEYLIDLYHDSKADFKDKSMIVGLSGTPYSLFLRKLYGSKSLVRPFSMIDIIKQGDMVNYKMILTEVSLDGACLTTNSTGEFNGNDSNDDVDKMAIAGHPARDWWENEETKNKYTMVFANSIKGAISLYKMFTEWAMTTGNIDPDRIAITHSMMKKDDVLASMEGCRTGRVLIIISVDQLTVGFDAPHFDVEMIFKFLAPNPSKYREPNSAILYIQRFARVMRKYSGGAVGISPDGIYRIFSGNDHAIDDAVEFENEFYSIGTILPPKRMAMILDYTNMDIFEPPYIIEGRYDELPQTRTKKENKEDEAAVLEDIEGKLEEPEKMLPTITCGGCGEIIIKPPICGACGLRMKDMRSTVIDGLEIELKNGVTRVVHVADNIKDIFKKIKEDREKQAIIDNRVKRVNYSKLTPDNRVGIMTAALYMMYVDGSNNASNAGKIEYAKYHSVASKCADNGGYNAVLRKARKELNVIINQKKGGDNTNLKEVSKFITKINGVNPKFKRSHKRYM